jgi:hypothetical protein
MKNKKSTTKTPRPLAVAFAIEAGFLTILSVLEGQNLTLLLQGNVSAVKIGLTIFSGLVIVMEVCCLWHDVKTAYEWGVNEGVAQEREAAAALCEIEQWTQRNKADGETENSAKI